jgi:Zn-dependent protease
LLPIPPLDGSHLIHAFFYKRFPNLVIWLFRYSMFILLVLFFMPFTREFLINLINLVFNFVKSLVF